MKVVTKKNQPIKPAPDWFRPSEERHGVVELYRHDHSGGPWPQDIARHYSNKVKDDGK